ncbi:gastric triacylglycerol lipase isoform X2 [Leptinotarsa decemlineata]|uniref:gastric triacylglycerol lipase isoform X2 n=1 Tax=Leptinotarsa decemlineata TaxID=7539 RepID=UPI003D30B754
MILKLVLSASVLCLIASLWKYLEYNYYDNAFLTQNISEIIRSWPNYTAEEHYLITEDGYEILVERAFLNISKPTPIIIVHGMAMNAIGWVNKENISLARLLGDLGYDIWMLNFRGTWYSKGHINLKSTDKDYWQFNLDDLGVHDVRSIVKLVYEKTNRQAIYIGYSMGTTSFFIYSSSFPDETKNYLKGMVALAPVINFKDSISILRFSDYVWPFLKITFPLEMNRMVDTIGSEVYTHLVQIHISGVFQHYDHGKERNLETYGTPTPPPYDLSKIPVPVAMFFGANDWLATPRNAKQAYSELQPSLRCGYHAVPFEKWNHLDFIIAKDLPKYLYEDMFHKISDIDSEKCVP